MPNAKTDGQKHREDMAARSRQRQKAVVEIGPLPKVANPRRKSKCRKSLRAFCETYFADRFALEWSADHLTVLARMEGSVLRGGLFALAMPRGSGKTTICEAAALWAVLYGHRRFVALVGSDRDAAVEMLDSIKIGLETNDLLAADFPEVCHPVACLEGSAGRANKQTLGGVRTRIGWAEAEARLPTVKGSKASGAAIFVAGITGRVRGMKTATADGKVLRPDFAIVDDPQTDESAESLGQTAKRLRVILGAVKGLAGPGKTISMAIPCTVIAPGDLSDQVLDRDKNPQFRGERMRMVYEFPTNQPLWDEYAEVRRKSLRAGRDGEEATEFYRRNRAAMDEGSRVAWPARFDPDNELSGVQAAMNLKIDNPIAFAAEYQNEPLVEAAVGMRALDPEALAGRLAGVPRWEVPRECPLLTAFVDVHKHILFYAVTAWSPQYGGTVVDYGTWPRQPVAYFRQADPPVTLAHEYKTLDSDDVRVHAGLKSLTDAILGREYRRHESGEPQRVSMCLVDRGWKPEVVHRVCRESAYTAVLRPSVGHSVGSTGRLVRQWGLNPGELAGPPGSPAWRWGYAKGEHAIGRRIIFDADDWKGFLADRLSTPPSGYAPLNLWGEAKAPPADGHRLFCDHLSAEFGGPGRTADIEYEKWQAKPNRDNHWWDAVVGSAVAASVAGLRWDGRAAAGEPPLPPPPPRPRISLADRQKQRRAGR